MAADSMLYTVCPACNGCGFVEVEGPTAGRPEGPTAGRLKMRRERRPCPLCQALHVVPIGLTAGQVERMANVARAAAEAATR